MPLDIAPQSAAPRQRRRSQRAHQQGLCGEAAAAQAYRRRGAELLAERFRGGSGEIDLVLRQGNMLVFVEVKTAPTLTEALSRVSADKAARLLDAAQTYLARHDLPQNQEMRFDIALVDAIGRTQICEAAIWFD